MKSDKDLFRALQERNKNVRLFTEAQILDLMAKARKEVIDDHKKRVPDMDILKKEFNSVIEEIENNPVKKAGYNRLSQDKLFWVWFTNGAAAVLKRFKDAN
jgi:hypothetical protein